MAVPYESRIVGNEVAFEDDEALVANGITKYTAQNANEEKELIVVWKTAGTVSIVSSLFVLDLPM